MKHSFKVSIGVLLATAAVLVGCTNPNKLDKANMPLGGDNIEILDTAEESVGGGYVTEVSDDIAEAKSATVGGMNNGTPVVASQEEKDSKINLQDVEGNDNIILDLNGYRPKGRKFVYIYGNNIDKKYEIVNVDSGRTVFANELKAVGNRESDGLTLYLGDFTDYITKGSFRIHNDDLGYSDIFTIRIDRFSSEFEEVYKKIISNQPDSTSDFLYVISNLLLTKDIYPNSYSDLAYINKSIEQVIELQNEVTGVVYSRNRADSSIEFEPEVTDYNLSAQFAGTLAQYSTIFNEDNPELSQRALAAAQKAFNAVEQNRDVVDSDIFYYAACELYRATGQYMYRSSIEWYDSLESGRIKNSCYKYLFSANVAYLNTNYRTDYDRCQLLMKNYIAQAGKISQRIDKSSFYVQKDIYNMSESQILDNMQKLALVSYVVSGYEYTSVLENYTHYLNGVNETKHKTDEDALMLSKKLFSLGHLYNM